jgi:hypothetical protein
VEGSLCKEAYPSCGRQADQHDWRAVINAELRVKKELIKGFDLEVQTYNVGDRKPVSILAQGVGDTSNSCG